MTMLNLDGVLVIYEGLKHRLRWEHQPGWIPALELIERPRPESRVLGHIWPNRTAAAMIRREIGHGQKAVVVLDGQSPVIDLPRAVVPRIPMGAIDLTESDGARASLCVQPLTWLAPKDRARGEAFASGAEDLFDEPHPPSSPHVEDDLIGTREPLRFVYYRRALGIDTLRDVIARVFSAQHSAQVLPIGHGHGVRPLPVRTPARKVA
ncbi:MAG TPA: hypothetical protein VES60_01680 [Nakamurella sp.]|nr:hypothetical protein [Nakamurella sp.]